MILSNVLRIKVKEILSTNLLSIDSLINDTINKKTLHPIIINALSNSSNYTSDNDANLIHLLEETGKYYNLRNALTSSVFEVKSLLADFSQTRLVLSDLKKKARTGKSYKENQIIKSQLSKHFDVSKGRCDKLKRQFISLFSGLYEAFFRDDLSISRSDFSNHYDTILNALDRYIKNSDFDESITLLEGIIVLFINIVDVLTHRLNTISNIFELKMFDLIKYVIEKEALDYNG